MSDSRRQVRGQFLVIKFVIDLEVFTNSYCRSYKENFFVFKNIPKPVSNLTPSNGISLPALMAATLLRIHPPRQYLQSAFLTGESFFRPFLFEDSFSYFSYGSYFPGTFFPRKHSITTPVNTSCHGRWFVEMLINKPPEQPHCWRKWQRWECLW
jgi:hypothetical protein